MPAYDEQNTLCRSMIETIDSAYRNPPSQLPSLGRLFQWSPDCAGPFADRDSDKRRLARSSDSHELRCKQMSRLVSACKTRSPLHIAAPKRISKVCGRSQVHKTQLLSP